MERSPQGAWENRLNGLLDAKYYVNLDHQKNGSYNHTYKTQRHPKAAGRASYIAGRHPSVVDLLGNPLVPFFSAPNWFLCVLMDLLGPLPDG